ncbi:GntR family transcriptional regulator, partial [Streptomyces sp. NPDC056084]
MCRLPSEAELTKTLGISRASLREATRALVHAGLLAVRQGDGT